MTRRFPWILTLVSVAVLAVLLALGVWQVQRLGWKEGLIAAAEDAATRPPAPLAEVLAAPNPEFRRALVVCPGLATAPYVELQSIHDGEGGSRLISICRAPGRDGHDGQTFLIDRGFVADAVSARPRVAASTLPLSMLVELRRAPPPGPLAPAPSGGRFYARDGAAMARALGADTPSRFTLFALASTNPELGGLQPSAPPAAFANNHLGYALTWFGLAIALVGVYAALLRRRMKAAGSAASPQAAEPHGLGDRDTGGPQAAEPRGRGDRDTDS